MPAEYNNFSTAWSSTAKADRTVDNLMTRLFSEETKLSVRNKTCDVVAFKTFSNKSDAEHKNRNPPRKMNCYSCGQTEHFANSCSYKKTSFSDTKDRCKYCKKNNHKSENCFLREEHEKREKNKTKVAYMTKKLKIL